MGTNILSFSSRKMPFAKLCLFFVAGILCGRFLRMPDAVISSLPYGMGLAVLALAFLEYKNKRFNRLVFPPVFHSLVLLAGFFAMKRDDPAHQSDYFGKHESTHIIGIIKDEPVYREKSIRFPVEVVSVRDSVSLRRAVGKLMATVKRGENDAQTFRYGDRIVFRNTAMPVPPPYNPGQFDYKRYLANKNIHRQAYLQPGEIRILSSGGGNPAIAFALRTREGLAEKFRTFVQHPEAFQISAALIFGHRTEMSAEVLEAFTNTGTVHVLSVSGLHVGLVFALLHYLLGFMDRWRTGRAFRLSITLLAIWSYVILTGMAPSILRAGTMITFFVLADWTERSRNSLNTLFASAFFLLLSDPHRLMEVGFQLSYTAVLGLFTLYPLFQKTFAVQNKYLRTLSQYTFVSVSAQLATAPLALFYFHQFPNYFLLGNLFIAIPSTLIMYLGLALAISPFQPLDALLGKAMEWLVGQTYLGLQKIDGLPYSVWQGIDLGAVETVSLSVGILLLVATWNYRQKTALWGFCACLLLLVAATSWKSVRKQDFRGIKIYNAQRNLSLAVFGEGKVHLVSTLDSAGHPQLRFHARPDLERYAGHREIAFSALDPEKRENVLLKTPGLGIAVLEKTWRPDSSGIRGADIVLWRNGNHTDMEAVKDAFLVFDGSNSDRRIAKLTALADSLGIAYYVLKDNFAYVREME